MKLKKPLMWNFVIQKFTVAGLLGAHIFLQRINFSGVKCSIVDGAMNLDITETTPEGIN